MNAFLPQFKTMYGPKAAGKKIALNVLRMQRASKDARFLSHSREPGNSLQIPRRTFLSETLLLQWVPRGGLCQRKQCVVRVV
jgi:hypothetical protein